MEQVDEDVLNLLTRSLSAAVPVDLEARILCSCRSRLFTTSCGRRRKAFQCAAICTLANIALAVIALRTHRRHVSLKDILYGG